LDISEKKGLLISVGGSLLVGIAGLVFSVVTESQAILLDGLFNLTYFIVGLFTLKVAKLVQQGDDEYFPAGYLFFEPLINGIKGMLILGISLMALWDAGRALFSGGRSISAGFAVVYGLIATLVCWGVAFSLRRKAAGSNSPLLKTDAAGWIVNAAISTATLIAFVSIVLLEKSPYSSVVPYMDPLLVVLVGAITLHVPVRMAWDALMELVNRSPSLEIRSSVRTSVEEALANVPIQELQVRVLQPGRTRLVFVHVILEAEAAMTVEAMDRLRDQLQSVLSELHSTTQLDVLFSKNPKWASPFGTVAESKVSE
jgi:cation diffusion facilitator family transporter